MNKPEINCVCGSPRTIRDISDDDSIPSDYFDGVDAFYLNKKIVCIDNFCESHMFSPRNPKKENNIIYETLLHVHIYHIIDKFLKEHNGRWPNHVPKNIDLFNQIIKKINVNDPKDWIKSQVHKYGVSYGEQTELKEISKQGAYGFGTWGYGPWGVPSFYWTNVSELFDRNVNY